MPEVDRHAPTAVLVVRLWAEGRLPEDLRARLYGTLDVTGGEPFETVVAGREGLLEAFAGWIEAFTADEWG